MFRKLERPIPEAEEPAVVKAERETEEAG